MQRLPCPLHEPAALRVGAAAEKRRYGRLRRLTCAPPPAFTRSVARSCCRPHPGSEWRPLCEVAMSNGLPLRKRACKASLSLVSPFQVYSRGGQNSNSGQNSNICPQGSICLPFFPPPVHSFLFLRCPRNFVNGCSRDHLTRIKTETTKIRRSAAH